VRNERRTECYALHRDLAHSGWDSRENALHGRTSPAYLAPADYREGGRLDLNPNSARFP